MTSSFFSDLDEPKNEESKSSFFSDLKEQPSKTKSVISAPVKGLAKGAQDVRSLLTPFLGPTPISAKAGEQILENLLPTREETTEKILERAGRLAPAVIGGPESLAARGAEIAGGAIGGHLAEEGGFGHGGQIVSEIIGMSLPGLARSLGMKAAKFFGKGAAKSAGESVSKIVKLKPEEIKTAVQEAGERLGVTKDLPLSSQVTNPKVQSIETKLMQSTAGKPIQEKLESLGGKLEETYADVGNKLTERSNLLPSVVSDEAVTALKNIEQESENAYRSLYQAAEKALPKTATSDIKSGLAIKKIIGSTMKKLKSSLGTPAKDALYARLNRLNESFSGTQELQRGMIPIEKLIELKQDLNQVIKYEVKGGVDKLLNPLQGVIRNSIEKYGKDFNPTFLNDYSKAEKLFGQNAKTFRQDPILRSLVSDKNPEAIFKKMNTVKGVKTLENVFNRTPEGKEALDVLKKYKLEDLLNKKILDKNGNISWGKAAGAFKDPKTRDLVANLVGPAQYKKLKDLSIVANGVEEGFKKFLNTSKTAVTAGDLALYVALPIKAVQQLFSGNVLGATKTVAAILVPSQLSKLIANPEFVESALKTAKAGKGNSASKFMDAAMKTARVVAQEASQEESEDQNQADQE